MPSNRPKAFEIKRVLRQVGVIFRSGQVDSLCQVDDGLTSWPRSRKVGKVSQDEVDQLPAWVQPVLAPVQSLPGSGVAVASYHPQRSPVPEEGAEERDLGEVRVRVLGAQSLDVVQHFGAAAADVPRIDGSLKSGITGVIRIELRPSFCCPQSETLARKPKPSFY